MILLDLLSIVLSNVLNGLAKYSYNTWTLITINFLFKIMNLKKHFKIQALNLKAISNGNTKVYTVKSLKKWTRLAQLTK